MPTHDMPTHDMSAGDGVSFARLALPPILVHSLKREGITMAFPIQAAAIPDALAGKDVLGRGPTGSGKTLAFGLPMLVRLTGAASKPGRPRGLILAPTRELAVQIATALDHSAQALGLRVAGVVGGVPLKRQVERLTRGVDLLVATPGRLTDHLSQGTVSLDDVLVTTVDEADHMANLGFLPQVTRILERTPPGGQRLLFSATLDGDVDALVSRYLHSPATHSTVPSVAGVTTMTHHLLYVDQADKWSVAAHIAARAGRTMMFVRTKRGVDRFAEELRRAGIAAGALHGDKTQTARTRTLDAFVAGTPPVLVTTDVAARGIHVDGISLVVHVDPPADPKDYLHRAGRTARAGAGGVVVTLVTARERHEVEQLTTQAGVEIHGIVVRSGDPELVAITGARTPPGIPLAPAPQISPRDSEHGRGARRGLTGAGAGTRDGKHHRRRAAAYSGPHRDRRGGR